MERYFFGCNTTAGFKSFYERELAVTGKVCILKGGPGTGKSTLMRSVSSEAKKRGYDVEEWYCSGDANSLDGVRVKELDAVVVDGTSPHALEPSFPVVKERLFNLAEAVNVKRVREDSEAVQSLINAKKTDFIRSYCNLKFVLCCLEREELCCNGRVNYDMLQSYAADIVGDEKRAEHERNMFARAITPQGEIAFFDHLHTRKTVLVKSENRKVKKAFFEYAAGLVGKAWFLHSPYVAEEIEGILLPDIAIVASTDSVQNACDVIDLDEAVKPYDRVGVEEAQRERYAKLQLAYKDLTAAYQKHIECEKLYAKAMDFARIDEIKAEIIKEIFG